MHVQDQSHGILYSRCKDFLKRLDCPSLEIGLESRHPIIRLVDQFVQRTSIEYWADALLGRHVSEVVLAIYWPLEILTSDLAQFMLKLNIPLDQGTGSPVKAPALRNLSPTVYLSLWLPVKSWQTGFSRWGSQGESWTWARPCSRKRRSFGLAWTWRLLAPKKTFDNLLCIIAC